MANSDSLDVGLPNGHVTIGSVTNSVFTIGGEGATAVSTGDQDD